MKIELELQVYHSGIIFLNYWDSMSGNDVCANIKDGKLFLDGEEISLSEFMEKVIEAEKDGDKRFQELTNNG